MKYDIFETDKDHEHDLIIEKFYEYPGNPYIFSKLTLEQSLRILSSEILEMSYCQISLITRLSNDRVDIFESLKTPIFLATIEGDWIKQSAINLLRIRSVIYDYSYDLPNRIDFFPDFMKIDNDINSANLVHKFIEDSSNDADELDTKIYQYWLDLIKSFLSITIHKREDHEHC